MCGILIFYSKNKVINSNIFKNSLELQKHRGPDHSGIIKISDKMIFGNVRLSITDLSSNSNQPMTSDYTSNVISFNGDIYNHIELKENLEKKGINFFSKGDTEVLLKYLDFYGIDGVNKLNGKWSFALYEKKNNRIIVSRDRFGKQPLYYFNDGNTIIFSSEIKSIFNLLAKKRVLDKKFVQEYLKFGYLANDSEQTIYCEIKRILPGITAIIDLNNQKIEIKFEKKNTIKNHLNKNSADNLDELIYDAVKIRLRNDVKNAVIVSGGVDSTLISTIAHKIDKDITFITGDSGVGKDLYFSRKLAKDLNIKLDEIKFNYQHDIIKRIENMTRVFEVPLNLYGQVVAMNILYEKVSNLGIRVLLDGSGGDEIYSGYFHRYSQHFINSLIKNRDFNQLFQFIFYGIKYKQVTLKEILKYLTQNFGNLIFEIDFKNKFFNYLKLNHDLHPSKKDKIFYSIEDYQLWDNEFGSMPSQLQLSDTNSMMYSMTTRNPLLDYRQIYNIKNKSNLKFHKGYNKYLLRNSIPTNVSSEIRWRRDKQPFKWFGDEILFNQHHEFMKEKLLESKILENFYTNNEIENIYKKKSLKKYKELFLRCFSLSMLEKVYKCQIN
ncbi:asparagine synthase (glutamine-hydrolyzing) [Candidatus Pelagibacter sp.]|jgi:asparagine synthase (glutamine-hydrolysing)|nr:asparagine synthase (glutamine-hydrolyzing) [Candidatus Pelagibacter sp.]